MYAGSLVMVLLSSQPAGCRAASRVQAAVQQTVEHAKPELTLTELQPARKM